MTAPWIQDATGNSFVTYDAAQGFVNAAFGSTNLTVSQPTDIVHENISRSLAGIATAWALRLGNGQNGGPVLSGGTVQIGSGGLILNPGFSGPPATHTSHFYFGNGTTPVEAVIRQTTNTSNAMITLAGTLTASALTYVGDGTTVLTANNRSTLGNAPVVIHSGALHLAAAGALGHGPVTVNAGALRLMGNFLSTSNALTFNGGMLELRTFSSTTFTSGPIRITENLGVSIDSPSTASVDFSLSAATTFSTGASGLPITLTSSDASSNTNLQFTGAVALNTDLIVSHDHRVRFLGGITGAGRLVKTGTGFMNLGSNNAGHSGDTELLRGTLYFTAATPSAPGG